MMLLDTSVLIPVVRSRGREEYSHLVAALGGADFHLSRFTQLELLQGANNEGEWSRLGAFIVTQSWLSPSDLAWFEGARIYFDLRRQGITIGSSIDCCIAQMALERDFILVHNDLDFEKISTVRPSFKQRRIEPLRTPA
jgi:predicted nucleic acid-binding protein